MFRYVKFDFTILFDFLISLRLIGIWLNYSFISPWMFSFMIVIQDRRDKRKILYKIFLLWYFSDYLMTNSKKKKIKNLCCYWGNNIIKNNI